MFRIEKRINRFPVSSGLKQTHFSLAFPPLMPNERSVVLCMLQAYADPIAHTLDYRVLWLSAAVTKRCWGCKLWVIIRDSIPQTLQSRVLSEVFGSGLRQASRREGEQ